MVNKDLDKAGKDLVVTLEDFFKKAPQLPTSARDVLVAITPWIALIFGILGVIAGLGLVGVSPLGLFGGVNVAVGALASGVLAILSSVLMLMAFPKLQKHVYGGWMLLFWSEVVNIVANLVTFNLVGALIGGLIGFYLLFQIKSYYK